MEKYSVLIFDEEWISIPYRWWNQIISNWHSLPLFFKTAIEMTLMCELYSVCFPVVCTPTRPPQMVHHHCTHRSRLFSLEKFIAWCCRRFVFSSSQFPSNFGHSFVIFKLVISDTLYRFATKMRWINLLIWRCPYIFTIFAFLRKNRNFIIIRLSYSKFHQFHLNRQQLRNLKLI